jgi:hypothetical protein
LPCESLKRFRSEPRPSTTAVQPPRICLNTSSVCWLGARFRALAVDL